MIGNAVKVLRIATGEETEELEADRIKSVAARPAHASLEVTFQIAESLYLVDSRPVWCPEIFLVPMDARPCNAGALCEMTTIRGG